MPKLALCFSGHSRTFEKCYNSIKTQILDKYECDIFISTWFESDELSTKIRKLYNPTHIEILNMNNYKSKFKQYSTTLPKVNISNWKISKTNNPNLSYEDNKLFIVKSPLKPEWTVNLNYISQFFGIHNAAMQCKAYIAENNIKYDYILRLRLDGKIHGIFTLSNIPENVVIVNNIRTNGDNVKIHDHFFMTRPNTFFKIANIYHQLPNIIYYINQNNYFVSGRGAPETLLFINIIKQNIHIKCSIGYKIHKHVLPRKGTDDATLNKGDTFDARADK